MSLFQEVLDFWFGKPEDDDYGKSKKAWFVKNSEFDRQVRSLFLSVYQQAAANQLDEWQSSPDSCLALIIVLDQFPRNMFRNQSQAFATDELALAIAKYAVSHQYDRQLLPVQRWFVYLPFEHSENLADQLTCVNLFLSIKDDPETATTLDYVYRHLEIIKEFGRFPHRNAILGRQSTQEELKFLQQPGSSF